MTATLDQEREATRTAYSVSRLFDRELLRSLLPDRAYAAYALAQLDPGRFQLSAWYLAHGPQGERGIVVHSASGLGRALFTEGDPDAVEAILSLHPGSRFSFGSLRPEHKPAVDRHFLMMRQALMLRMAVSAASFRPVEGDAVRLHGADVAAVNRLYSTEGGPTSYPASHLDEGVYYGVMADARLVAIAGTHVVSEAEGVAVVGNVFTHPRYRNLGFSRIATSAVTRELLQRCPLVVLTVDQANEPAVRVYRRLGYEVVCTLHESPLLRKEPTGLAALARRTLAAWRGRHEGKEVVLR